MLFLLSVEFARCAEQFLNVSARQFAITVVFVVLQHVEINRALADICVASIKNFLDVLNLLNDVTRSVRLDAWRKNVKRLH